MKRKSVEDLLMEKCMSIGEAERMGLTDLIEECKKREKELDELEASNMEKLRELEKSVIELFSGLDRLKKVTDDAVLRFTPKNKMYNC
jgi:DNA phosphorothioation-dependent restriction protein DptG